MSTSEPWGNTRTQRSHKPDCQESPTGTPCAGGTRGKDPHTPIQRWKSVTKLICVNVFRKGMSKINALFCMPGAIMAVRRGVLDELGCFDESFRAAVER